MKNKKTVSLLWIPRCFLTQLLPQLPDQPGTASQPFAAALLDPPDQNIDVVAWVFASLGIYSILDGDCRRSHTFLINLVSSFFSLHTGANLLRVPYQPKGLKVTGHVRAAVGGCGCGCCRCRNRPSGHRPLCTCCCLFLSRCLPSSFLQLLVLLVIVSIIFVCLCC